MCDLTAKRSQIEVPMDDFARVFAQAIDDLGCKDSVCRNGDQFENITKPEGGTVTKINGRDLHPEPKE